MSKELPSTPEKISRQQIIDIYKRFADKGIRDPGNLDLNDPEVKKAQELENLWNKQAEGTSNSHRHNFEKTILMLDAGFTNPDYAAEVKEWLMLDLDDLTEDESELAEEIKAKISQIEKMVENG